MNRLNEMRILVVDDENIVLESCRRVLEAEGFEVVLVPSAEEALKALDRETFSLVLLDLKMPKRDGQFLIGEIKKRAIHVPLMVMTGYSTLSTIKEVANMGIEQFIAKPFTPEELVEAIQEVIGATTGPGEEKGA
jgi:DNA-binding NtrC family response regulator